MCKLQTAEECKTAGAAAVEVFPCDVSNAKGIDELCSSLLDKHKCIDVVVHSAGIFPMTGQTPLEGALNAIHHAASQTDWRVAWCLLQQSTAKRLWLWKKGC